MAHPLLHRFAQYEMGLLSLRVVRYIDRRAYNLLCGLPKGVLTEDVALIDYCTRANVVLLGYPDGGFCVAFVDVVEHGEWSSEDWMEDMGYAIARYDNEVKAKLFAYY